MGPSFQVCSDSRSPHWTTFKSRVLNFTTFEVFFFYLPCHFWTWAIMTLHYFLPFVVIICLLTISSCPCPNIYLYKLVRKVTYFFSLPHLCSICPVRATTYFTHFVSQKFPQSLSDSMYVPFLLLVSHMFGSWYS